jgi:NDP-sugar pyrophosphorylase family protein
LREHAPDRPKALVQVAGRPFLSYLLDRLAAAGLKTVVLCTGYLGEQIRQAFGETYGAMQLRYAQESAPLGTAGALRHALPLLEAETVLAMNGDAFWDVDLQAFWHGHVRRDAAASMVLARVADAGRYGRVQMDRLGRVRAFEEKSAGGPGWINAGVYLLSRQVIARIPQDRAVSIEHEVFPQWVGRGFYGYRSRGRFLDIGTPASYRMAERFVRARRVARPAS